MRLKVFCGRDNASRLKAAGTHEHASRSGGMDSRQVLTFYCYMGRNTPERKDYIMENLVVPVED